MEAGVACIPSTGERKCINPISKIIRDYIIDNLIFEEPLELSNSYSLLDAGLLDSTAAMEMVEFLQSTFGIAIGDHDITPDNFDSIESISRLVVLRSAETRAPADARAPV
jgi:acyl carrier protein